MATLSPQAFAELDAAHQRDYQVSEAQAIFQAIERGDTVSESQRDFAFRILGKVQPNAPTPSGFENTAKGITDLAKVAADASTTVAGTIGKNIFLTMWPVYVVAILAIIGLYFWGRRNG